MALVRGGMEKFVILPFSVGCVSQSSVAVVESRRSPSGLPREGDNDDILAGGKPKPPSSALLLALPGLQRLIKGFKGLSQLFNLYRPGEEGDGGMEMVIGFPTDVKHVAHVGWEGSGGVPSIKGWDRGPELLALPTISLRQFELTMAAQPNPPSSLFDSTS